MQAKKCDRCGKFYDPIKLHGCQFIARMIAEPEDPVYEYCNDGYYDFDLCEECQEELDDFMFEYDRGEKI